MKTLIAWLIANIEVILTVIIAVWLLIEWISGNISNNTAFGIAAVATFIIVALFTRGVRWLMVIVCFTFYIYLYLKEPDIFWMLIIPSAIVSAVAAVFTAIFMEEVVSRRMLYVNSSVSMLETTALYVLNRLTVTFLYTSTALFLIKFGDKIVV